MCESDGSRYPDSVVLEAIAAFEQQVTQDSLSALRGATFSTKRLARSAPPAGNDVAACNWRLCFGATPFKSKDGTAAVQCQSSFGVLKSDYVKNLREQNETCFLNVQTNLDGNNRRLVRAEMLYMSAVKMLSHHSHSLHVTKSIDIVAEVCARASYEDLLGFERL